MSLHLRILLIIGAVWFLGLTIYYIKRKHLDLYHSIRWFAGAVVILVMAVFPGILGAITNLVGMELPSNLVFMLMILYLLLTCLSLSASVSRQHTRIKTLVQETAQLENRIRELEKKIGSENEKDTGDRTGV